MPIYEYQCLDCGKLFEILQKISDEPLRTCSHCSGRLNRLISNCSFQLKGSGWYVTDYKTPADAARGNGTKRSDVKEESATETKEVKTEAKTETTKSEATGGATTTT